MKTYETPLVKLIDLVVKFFHFFQVGKLRMIMMSMGDRLSAVEVEEMLSFFDTLKFFQPLESYKQVLRLGFILNPKVFYIILAQISKKTQSKFETNSISLIYL